MVGNIIPWASIAAVQFVGISMPKSMAAVIGASKSITSTQQI